MVVAMTAAPMIHVRLCARISCLLGRSHSRGGSKAPFEGPSVLPREAASRRPRSPSTLAGRARSSLTRPQASRMMAVSMNPRTLALAYSVDADDAFMFHAVRESLIDTRGLTFSHHRADTAALNRLAIAGGAHVVAISAGVYPAVAAQYQLLPHGASVGRGLGP